MPVTTDLDPAKYIINFGGANINGFADGTFMTFEFDEDFYNTVVGSDGFTTRIRTNNKTGLLTITLLQSSPSNDILQTFFDIDRTAPRGAPQPLLMKNLLGREIMSSSQAWVQKQPSLEMSKEVSNREWNIRVADAIVFVGGNSLFQG